MSERTSRVLTWAFAVLLVALIATVWYLAANPGLTNPAHTEFYLLGSEGNASDYPSTLGPGESAEVTVGIANHEHRAVAYGLEVRWNGSLTQDRTIQLADGETREFTVVLTAPSQPGPYLVRFLLYKGEASEPDLTTHLVIRVQA